VPNGPTDIARFAGSSITGIKFSSAMTEVAEIVFTPDAGSFNITADSDLAHTAVTLTISGAGITNNSGVTQNLIASPNGTSFGLGTIEFRNAATAGKETVLTAVGSDREGAFNGSEINFYETATASFVAEGATGSLDAYGGEICFFDNATAAEASFTATGSVGGYGGEVNFLDSSTAHQATFTTESGSNGSFFGGEANFSDNSTAETAQFTVAGGDST
jgi:hypothetical protein